MSNTDFQFQFQCVITQSILKFEFIIFDTAGQEKLTWCMKRQRNVKQTHHDGLKSFINIYTKTCMQDEIWQNEETLDRWHQEVMNALRGPWVWLWGELIIKKFQFMIGFTGEKNHGIKMDRLHWFCHWPGTGVQIQSLMTIWSKIKTIKSPPRPRSRNPLS